MDAASRMLHLEESLMVLGHALTIDDMMQFAGERLGERVSVGGVSVSSVDKCSRDLSLPIVAM